MHMYAIVNTPDSNKGRQAMFIKVETKKNFGNEAIYPACEKSQLFAEIAGTKTLTRDTLSKIKALGYQIQQHLEIEEF
jgi:hypothetical protein